MSIELIIIIIYSVITPLLAIYSFILGTKSGSGRPIFPKKTKKEELSEDEKMLKRIDSAKVYDEVI